MCPFVYFKMIHASDVQYLPYYTNICKYCKSKLFYVDIPCINKLRPRSRYIIVWCCLQINRYQFQSSFYICCLWKFILLIESAEKTKDHNPTSGNIHSENQSLLHTDNLPKGKSNTFILTSWYEENHIHYSCVRSYFVRYKK